MMSSNMYPHLIDYNLSSDDDDIRKSAGNTPHPKNRMSNFLQPNDRKSDPLAHLSERYHPSSDLAAKMKAASKYDHKPRNVEYDGRSFRPRRSRSRDGRGLLSGTVSIADFERNDGFFEGQGEVKSHRERETPPSGLYMWLTDAHWQRRLAMACVMGVVFGILYRGYNDGLYLGISPKDDFLECPSKMDKPCLTSSQLKSALPFVQSLSDHLHTRAGQAECGENGISKEISIHELQTIFPKSDDILYLIHHNPHWNVVWLDSNGNRVSDWSRYPLDTDLLQSTTPSISVMCTISRFVGYIWTKIKFIFFVAMVLVVLLGVVRWYIQKKRLFERNKFIMINEILGVLRRHNDTIVRKKSLLPYLAIIHVRDMLITPSERDSKFQIWEQACLWIAKYESRIRTEQHRIAGEDFACWRWIQQDPPKMEHLLDGTATVEEKGINPSTTASLPSSSTSSSSLVSKGAGTLSLARKKNWYSGTTFEDEAGRRVGRNHQMNMPYGSPSPCIRLKNMFETKRHLGDEQSKEIEDSVLDRCIPHGGVVHIYVDRRSNFGCVFLKMDCIESAVGAYNGLHGGWYKGKLVTAKYIPIEKYHKWFPLAATAKTHITPSS